MQVSIIPFHLLIEEHLLGYILIDQAEILALDVPEHKRYKAN